MRNYLPYLSANLIVLLLLCQSYAAEQDANPPVSVPSADADAKEQQPPAAGKAETKTGDAKETSKTPTKRREPVKVVDISPELATHVEIEPLSTEFKRLTSFRLRPDGVLIVADGEEKRVRTISADGQEIASTPLEFVPEALDFADDNSIYCGGQGKLAVIDAGGNLVKVVAVPDSVAPKPPTTEAEPKSEKTTEQPAAKSSPRRRKRSRPRQISGVAVSDRDVFVAFGSGWSTGSKSKLFRFDRDLQNPVQLAEGLRGCCQRCDIRVRNGVLYLAENSAHRVVLYDRDGVVLNKWGERGRDNLETFGACCNPMNICFDADGTVVTSESGLGRIKRYASDGKFVELVGYVRTARFWNGSSLASSCSNMTIESTADGELICVMDYRDSKIRILQKKSVSQQTAE
jgi:hypothetical protein